MDPLTVWPGASHPLGATWDGEGVNFALFSEHAERVQLCLFDAEGSTELQRVDLPERTNNVWHGYFPQLRPGQLYNYRVFGPYRPEDGHRFDPRARLVDPYARSLVGEVRWADTPPGAAEAAIDVPRCRVVDEAFSWDDDRHPRTPWSDTVIYEAHLRGLTRCQPRIPAGARGTCEGLASPAMVDYLQRLGVTAVELLPVHAYANDWRLQRQGLSNYWGYNSLAYFAPHPAYLRSGRIAEFKTMVKTLHSAGIEVILDVVYNHTAEGGSRGPTLSLRGIDNAVYYRLDEADRERYVDHTGCGNTLNLTHPRVLQLVTDSLRYWVESMHVDGFRFDLATTLARGPEGHEHEGPFLATLAQDPVLSQVKLIAEPWDLGPDGYRLGGFPHGWAEWNDRYRDATRAYWRGDKGSRAEFVSRLAGSSDIYQHAGRPPQASVNFVTAHDGFTLRDLVSYRRKHNDPNREDNQDGSDHNLSCNYGVEGATDSARIRARRLRHQRNLLATLMLSQGVPMLLAGDELNRTQQGNNNAYCQDNEVSWLDWSLNRDARSLLRYTRRLIALRRRHPVLRRRAFFQGQAPAGRGKDVVWLAADGHELTADDWADPEARSLGALFVGAGISDRDARGRRQRDADLLLLTNPGSRPTTFTLLEAQWQVLIDTAAAVPIPRRGPVRHGSLEVPGRSLVLLQSARESARD